MQPAGKGCEEGPLSAASEHGGTRTPDTQNRNLMLYPTELHALSQAAERAAIGMGCRAQASSRDLP